MAKKFDIEVKGIMYYVTPSTLKLMAKQTPMPVRLEREPGNPHDHNAIKVILDVKPWKDFHIGHVAKVTAAALAPKMDSGAFNPEEAWLMWVNPDKSTAGVLVKVEKGKD